MSLTVEPRAGEFRWAVIIDGSMARSPDAEPCLAAVIEHTWDMGGGSIQLWIREISDEDDAAAVALGFEPYRDLWQLRVDLPTPPSSLPVRTYAPGDAEALVAVNNRAFSWHPEQGSMTPEELAQRMDEPWFDRTGLLVHEVEGTMAGFCWTKVHTDTEPPMGEIYVICVDPAFHGRGIGDPLTRAGLDHLHATGIDVGMLYVESDNTAAHRIYDRIGFRHHHTDRAFRLDRPMSQMAESAR